jgi:hypothetical protein
VDLDAHDLLAHEGVQIDAQIFDVRVVTEPGNRFDVERMTPDTDLVVASRRRRESRGSGRPGVW